MVQNDVNSEVLNDVKRKCPIPKRSHACEMAVLYDLRVRPPKSRASGEAHRLTETFQNDCQVGSARMVKQNAVIVDLPKTGASFEIWRAATPIFVVTPV